MLLEKRFLIVRSLKFVGVLFVVVVASKSILAKRLNVAFGRYRPP